MRRRTAAAEAPLEPSLDPTGSGEPGSGPHDTGDAGASAHPGHHKSARPVRTRPDASSLPGDAAVNLLSPWVMDELRVRTLQQRLVAGLVILLVVLGLGWAGLSFALSRDEASLRADEAQADALQAQVGEMAPVRGYAAAVAKRGRDVAEMMAPEVAFSRAATGLDAALPDGVTLESVDLVLVLAAEDLTADLGSGVGSGASQLSCPGPDPFGARTISGCITLTGTAGSREQVSDLVSTLAGSRFFVEPFITTTTTGEDEVEFSGTVGLDPRLLRGEYADLAAPAPDPAATPAADATGETP